MIRFGKENRPPATSESQSFTSLPAWQTCAAIDDPARVIPAVEFRFVTFSYTDDRRILDGVSFQVIRGDTLLVLSGSGGSKLTIFELLMGLLQSVAGQILIEGEDITDYDEAVFNRVRQKIGIQF